jgi:ketosteroid isomerase-like protein
MIRKSLVAFALLVGCASTDPVSTEDVRRELELTYQSLAEANARRDMSAIVAMWTDDFSLVEPDGSVTTAAEVRSAWQELLDTSLDPLHFRYSIQGLEVREGEAIATVQQEVSRMRAIDGELRQLDTVATQRETWVKTEQGWRLRRISDVREQRRLVDGVPSDQS